MSIDWASPSSFAASRGLIVHSLRSFTSLRLTKQMMVDSTSGLALTQRFAIGWKYLSSTELAPGARPDGRAATPRFAWEPGSKPGGQGLFWAVSLEYSYDILRNFLKFSN